MPFKELLYNRKHKRRRPIIENVFSILIFFFKELQKYELHVTFLPKVCMCCCMLHNFFGSKNEATIVQLIHIIVLEVNTHDEG
jgi:hypothetical protein